MAITVSRRDFVFPAPLDLAMSPEHDRTRDQQRQRQPTMLQGIPIIVKSVASIVSSSAPARNAKPMRALRESIDDASESPNSGTNA